MADDTRVRLRVSNKKAYVWDVDGNNLPQFLVLDEV
jgi:hypothetical protein